MNRLFLRFLFPVLLSIGFATALVYIVVISLFGDPIEKNAEHQAAPQIFLLEQYIDKAGTDEWLARLNKVREVSQVQFELIPMGIALEKMGRGQREKLLRGAIVMDAANKAFYRRVDLNGERYIGSEEDVLSVQNLPIDYWFNVQLEILRFVIIAFVLLIPIAYWSRAHWRDIQALSKVAADIGEGKLRARSNMAERASIYPLSEKINQMAGRIEELLSAQKSLLHSVSHELRTPIARLEFALEILQEQLISQGHHQQVTRIVAMQDDLGELNQLVAELLNMAKIDAQDAIQKEFISSDELMHLSVQQLPPIPDHIDLQIQNHSAHGLIYGDQRLLLRAIQNLLKNAMKYADQRVLLSLSNNTISVGQNKSTRYLIVVEDDGAGIPESEYDAIFEPFYRLDRSRDRATGGFGLGLSIVKQIIARHGGLVIVSRSSLGGARFEIQLPQ
ncbi:ATP-binding protein [Undibacterium fentianense]|uniref:histidine kinase n=1 Tax=Undibacterium fentianense TaxID=2828728 RepID=A0A941IEG7_9BURK|nr:ATP-binding protein [Undibacterium fentianense]MBR7799382.1 two-component sensor histidine kinase [Undibacterium fentianense]